MTFARILAAAGLAALSLAPAAARAGGELAVCLEDSAPPISFKEKKEAGGFDLALAQALAKRLDRSLKVQWFDIELEEDSNLTIGANALMSDGHCQLVASYPIVRGALTKPGVDTGWLPDFEGRKSTDIRRRVPLGTVAPSRPYYYSALTVVLGPAAASHEVKTLADLQGMKLIAPESSLADAILMTYGNRRFSDHVTHVVPGPRGHLLERLDKGEFDATLTSIRNFDAYRAEHPANQLHGSGFFHKIGFNMGFVALDKDQALLNEVNAALADMQAKGEVKALAQAAGVTYLPPHQPDITENVSLTDLFAPE